MQATAVIEEATEAAPRTPSEPPDLDVGFTGRMSSEEEALYAEASRRANVRNGKSMLGGLGLLNLLWWLSDTWIFARSPHTVALFAQYRPFFTMVAFVGYLVLDLTARRRLIPPLLVLTLFGGTVFFGEASLCGEAGGPGTPWFSFLYLTMLAPLIVCCSFQLRVLLETGTAAALILGYFQLRREYWSDAFTPATLSFLFAVWIVALGAGAIAEQRRRQTFVLRRAIAKQAEVLREWNESLEARVQLQTQELRSLTAYNESAREDERARISRELHDELGQELTALRYALNVVEKRYARDATSITANLKDLQMLLGRTATTVRQIVTDLRPRVLDDLGLGAAAEWLVQRTRERTSIDCRLTMPDVDWPQLPDDVTTTAFRILQESLTNVARHSEASHVYISLSVDEQRMQLTIMDDGVGLAQSKAGEPDRKGMGLIGMRERARALGGELLIEPTSPHGTTIRARLPLAKALVSRS